MKAEVLSLNRAHRPLITEAYRAMQVELHKRADYGVASIEFAPLVASYLATHRITELLDYGCGKGRLGVALRERFGSNITIHEYDPAVPEFSDPPQPCGTVACIDVLEHIEPDLLENVLTDLERLARRCLICTVHTGPAAKVLADGRNAHLIQRPADAWVAHMATHFRLLEFRLLGNGFWSVWGAK
jgi:hypothetical protein